MIIYFLSGLGADERIFQKLYLPPGYEMRHIHWEAVQVNQTLESYANQLARHIDQSEPFLLAGLSFGGIVAAEISKFLRPEKLILFSSTMTRFQLPKIYRLAGKLYSDRLLPDRQILLPLQFLYWFFGPVDHESRKLIASYLKRSDPVFLRWALGQISRWHNEHAYEPHVHIHGSRDRVFPVSLTKADYVIDGGGHFSVITHADEINSILMKELEIKQRFH
jgi:pimeloyl-ACP methyl ester carboxylesterase